MILYYFNKWIQKFSSCEKVQSTEFIKTLKDKHKLNGFYYPNAVYKEHSFAFCNAIKKH